MTLTTALLAVALAQAAPAPAPAAPTFNPTPWGFVDFQFSQTDAHRGAEDTSTFELRRARIGLRGQVTREIGYNLLFDGADSAMKDAYASIKYLPGLEIRLGQWKTPFGYEQSTSDTKLLWVNSSYVVASLARGPDSRDLGAGVIGAWPVAGPVSAELAASVVNGAGPNKKDDLDEKDFWGRGGLAVKRGATSVRLGGSLGTGHQVQSLGANAKFDGVGTPSDDTYFHFLTYGGDVQLDTPWLFAVAELIQSERDVAKYASATTVARSDVTARGWTAGVYGKTPWNVGPIFRAERYDPNRAVKNDLAKRYTVGAYADVLPVNARLILNYEFDESQTGAASRPGNRAIAYAQVVF